MTSKWILFTMAAIVGGLSDADVIFVNNTGLPIARVYIDSRLFETNPNVAQHDGKALVSVTPARHDLRVVFRGGAEVKWPHFNFQGVHEIFFERSDHAFQIRVQ